ncbi:hypothetical protein RS9917_01407 [Synechococcus sp. RS9917]|nr:hypothetical protein RS9917_01407 [Synechococcus sp. RS9917]
MAAVAASLMDVALELLQPGAKVEAEMVA